MDQLYPTNQVPIDYNINLYLLDNKQIAEYIARHMLGHYVISKNRCYRWNGQIWHLENLGHIFGYINNHIAIKFRQIIAHQEANGERFPARVINNIKKIHYPTRANKIAKELLKVPEIQFHGQWNSNPYLEVTLAGLWDRLTGNYVENSKDYYIRTIKRENNEEIPNIEL